MRDSGELSVLMHEGTEALARRRLDDAETIFRGVIESEPGHLAAHIKLGHISQETNRLDEAHRHYTVALERDPGNPEVLYGQALLAERLGLYKEAEKKYLECLTRDPYRTAARLNLAAVLLRMGDPDGALKQYRQGLETDPKNFLLHRNLGAMHQQANREPEAREAYITSLNLNQDQPDVLYNLSQVLINLGEWEQAQSILKKLGSLKGGAQKAKIRLEWLQARMEKERQVRALVTQGELDRAARVLRRIAQQNERDLSAHLSLGDLHVRKEEHDRALDAYGKAEGIACDHPGLQMNIATALHNLGRVEEAIPRYERHLELSPDDVTGLLHLGLALIQCDRNKDALDAFEKALRLNPEMAEVHNNKGVALKREGRFEEAGEAYRKAIRYNPRYVEAYFNLANLYYEMGHYEDAGRSYEQVLEINPEFTQARVNMEWLRSQASPGAACEPEKA